LALLSGKTFTAAARAAGVNEKTLRGWASQDEVFKRELADGRRTAFQAGMDRLQALSGKAIDTLSSLMEKDIASTVRLGAARTVVELGLHERDAELIARRLDELEALVREQEKDKKL
jgi:hypothetical protein